MPRTSGVYVKPAGSTAVSGEVISSSAFNTLIDDIIDDLNSGIRQFAGCRLTISSAQSIANDTQVAVDFDTETWDTDSLHDAVTNTTRATIPAGWTKVLVVGSGQWADNSTGFRSIQFYKNGSGVNVGQIITAVSTNNANRHTVVGELAVSGGDYIQLRAYQTSGSALNLNAASMSVRRIDE